jgi:cellulose synthase/poly-beta-1,6-N-acetylglucosamine synthase-like glycosyltransferase
MAEPPHPEIIAAVDPDAMLQGHWVPLRIEAAAGHRGVERSVLVVATAEGPDPALAAQLCSRYGVDDVRFVVTTDWDIDQAVLQRRKHTVIARAAEGLAETSPELSARTGWARWQLIAVAVALVAIVACAIVSFRSTLIVALIGINLMFFVGVMFKIAACVAGMVHVHRIESGPEESRRGALRAVPRIPDADLPVYTILVPAYHESNVVSKVIEHIDALDYPLSKLQVLLLMEADDDETIAAAKAARPPEYVRFVVVPPGGPQTKPKACNVGLALAEGEFLVIYDAEDRPEPGQLREAVARFAQSDESVVCFQARLNYFNATENILTRMFTLEYSFWFDYMLPGLDAWKLPIPLGGTSNHFRVDALRELGGWDPYNVTEDADLGVRAAAEGRVVGITESTTWEEACSEWKAWIRQRTRWIKGYMMTALVHTRRPLQLWRTVGWRGVLGVVALIAGTPAMFLACPLVWGFWLFTFLGGSVDGLHLPDWVLTVTTANLIIGNGAMILLSALAARRRKAYDLVPFALLNPAYWVLHSIAAWRALYQLVRNPSHWEKTPHGIVHGPHAPLVAAGATVTPLPAATSSTLDDAHAS